MFEAGMINVSIKDNESEIDTKKEVKLNSKKDIVENKIENKAENKVENEETIGTNNVENISKKEKDVSNKTKAINKIDNRTDNNSISYWNNILNKLKQNGKMGVYVNLIGSTAKQVNDLVVEIKLANQNSFAKQILETHENKTEIEKIVSEEFGKPMNIKFINEDKKNNEQKNSDTIENIVNNFDIPFNVIDE